MFDVRRRFIGKSPYRRPRAYIRWLCALDGKDSRIHWYREWKVLCSESILVREETGFAKVEDSLKAWRDKEMTQDQLYETLFPDLVGTRPMKIWFHIIY